MRVFLTGACGTLGRSATTALLQAGHDVVGLTRRSSPGTDAALQLVRGSSFDRPAMTRLMQGCDAVVNVGPAAPVGYAAIRPGAWRWHDHAQVVGSARVAEAAATAGVPRLVQVSSSVLYAAAGDDWVDEHSTIDLTQTTEPVVIAESNAENFGRKSGDHVVLRLGRLVGPHPHTRWMVRRARSGRPTGFGDPASWIHLLHVEDAGTAVVCALTAPPGTYNVGAEPSRRIELSEQYALAGERSGARFHSATLQRFAGHRLEMLTRSQRVSSQRYSDRTGWYPQHPKLTPEWFDDVTG
ncbi:NAD-dependent epimerase/dehydratase family protein [Aeromicrobium sp. CTD01-1L150]|uniref:NAD-dependent epimerase/dehydratase family protein n=1 Tax=Aeromicrobium sp. CTD01-1L150 TaxID=3341830 RepID=UPI0035C0F502